MDGFHLDVADRWAESKPHGSALDHTKLQRCSASTSFANTYQDDSNLPHPGTEGSFRTQSRTGSPSRSSRYATGIKYRLSHRLCLAFPVSFFYLFFIIFSIQANDAAALLNSFMPVREHHRNDPFDDPSMSAAHLFQKHSSFRRFISWSSAQNSCFLLSACCFFRSNPHCT